MIWSRQPAKKGRILDALVDALDALLDKAGVLSDAVARRPQLQPIPVRARRARDRVAR